MIIAADAVRIMLPSVKNGTKPALAGFEALFEAYRFMCESNSPEMLEIRENGRLKTLIDDAFYTLGSYIEQLRLTEDGVKCSVLKNELDYLRNELEESNLDEVLASHRDADKRLDAFSRAILDAEELQKHWSLRLGVAIPKDPLQEIMHKKL